jgi:hypothetical protein
MHFSHGGTLHPMVTHYHCSFGYCGWLVGHSDTRHRPSIERIGVSSALQRSPSASAICTHREGEPTATELPSFRDIEKKTLTRTQATLHGLLCHINDGQVRPMGSRNLAFDQRDNLSELPIDQAQIDRRRKGETQIGET